MLFPLPTNAQIHKALTQIPDLKALPDRADDLQQQIITHKNRLEKINKLEQRLQNNYKNSSIINLEKKQKELEQQIQTITSSLDTSKPRPNKSEKDVRNLVMEQNKIKNNYIQCIDQMEQHQKRLEQLTVKKQSLKDLHIDTWGKIHSPDYLEKMITIQNNQKEWNEWLLKKQEWTKRKEKTIQLQEEMKKCNQSYNATLKLKEKIKETQSIVLNNLIDNINTSTQMWLDDFFPNNPLYATIKTWKTSKKGDKPQIDISIQHKDREIEVGSLSGGELARVSLAYTLALAGIFNSPIILLDECTASLDEEATSTVFDSIKENFQGDLGLIIAHQVVKGDFDYVLEL